MAHLDTVLGIEKLGWKGICIQCDICGVTYNGGNGTTKKGPVMPNGYRGTEAQLLRDDARALGWTGDMTYTGDNDKCPKCSKGEEFIGRCIASGPKVIVQYDELFNPLYRYLLKADQDVEITFKDIPEMNKFWGPQVMLVIAVGDYVPNITFPQPIKWHGAIPFIAPSPNCRSVIRVFRIGADLYSQQI